MCDWWDGVRGMGERCGGQSRGGGSPSQKPSPVTQALRDLQSLASGGPSHGGPHRSFFEPSQGCPLPGSLPSSEKSCAYAWSMGSSPRGRGCRWRLAGTVAEKGPICSQDELCCWLLLSSPAAGWGEIPRGLLRLQPLGPPGQLRGTTPTRSSAGGLRHRGWAWVVAMRFSRPVGVRAGRHFQEQRVGTPQGPSFCLWGLASSSRPCLAPLLASCCCAIGRDGRRGLILGSLGSPLCGRRRVWLL